MLPADDAVGRAVDAVDEACRAVAASAAPNDPLLAAALSALSCATELVALHRKQDNNSRRDIDPVRDVLGSARAVVVEVTYALRDMHGVDSP